MNTRLLVLRVVPERTRESLLNAFGTSLDGVRFDRGVDLKPETADH